MSPSPCRIVLVRPRNPNNIGAAARAMKNFGLRELVVVAPHPPVWAEVVSAVNAGDVIAGARVVASLAEAVADCTLVVGTADQTRVVGKQPLYTPADLSRELRATEHRPALVFGSEKHGLTNDELNRCRRILSIPTQPACPSMNLGQAVAVCCYELAREAMPLGAERRTPTGATAGEMEVALQLALDVLRRADFTLPNNEPDLTRKLRRSLLRFELTQREAQALCGLLRKIRDQLS